MAAAVGPGGPTDALEVLLAQGKLDEARLRQQNGGNVAEDCGIERQRHCLPLGKLEHKLHCRPRVGKTID